MPPKPLPSQSDAFSDEPTAQTLQRQLGEAVLKIQALQQQLGWTFSSNQALQQQLNWALSSNQALQQQVALHEQLAHQSAAKSETILRLRRRVAALEKSERDRTTPVDIANQTLTQKNEELAARIKPLQETIRLCEEKITQLMKEASDLQGELYKSKANIQLILSENKELKVNYERFQNEYHQLNTTKPSSIDKKLNQLEENYRKKELEAQSLKEHVQSLKEEIQRLQEAQKESENSQTPMKEQQKQLSTLEPPPPAQSTSPKPISSLSPMPRNIQSTTSTPTTPFLNLYDLFNSHSEPFRGETIANSTIATTNTENNLNANRNQSTHHSKGLKKRERSKTTNTTTHKRAASSQSKAGALENKTQLGAENEELKRQNANLMAYVGVLRALGTNSVQSNTGGVLEQSSTPLPAASQNLVYTTQLEWSLGPLDAENANADTNSVEANRTPPTISDALDTLTGTSSISSELEITDEVPPATTINLPRNAYSLYYHPAPSDIPEAPENEINLGSAPYGFY